MSIQLMTDNQTIQVILISFATLAYCMVIFGLENVYNVKRYETRLRLFIEYILLLSFLTLFLFIGRLVVEDEDCDPTEGVCERVYMGFLNSRDHVFKTGFVLIFLTVLNLFNCLLILVLATVKENLVVKLRFSIFMTLSKRGWKNCAKKVLHIGYKEPLKHATELDPSVLKELILYTEKYDKNSRGNKPVTTNKMYTVLNKYVREE